jgi:hypothetical protein
MQTSPSSLPHNNENVESARRVPQCQKKQGYASTANAARKVKVVWFIYTLEVCAQRVFETFLGRDMTFCVTACSIERSGRFLR